MRREERNALGGHQAHGTKFRYAVLVGGVVAGEVHARHVHEARHKLRTGDIAAPSRRALAAARDRGCLGPLVPGSVGA